MDMGEAKELEKAESLCVCDIESKKLERKRTYNERMVRSRIESEKVSKKQVH